MQKKLLVAAVLSAFAGAASAQSANVTLYGTIFADFESAGATGSDASAAPAAASGGASSIRAGGTLAGTAGNMGNAYTTTPADQGQRTRTQGAGSNFGLRGTEDLGNGLSAWFQIEIGTSAAAGALGPSVGTSAGGYQAATYRNTAVGLRSNSWGSVLIGTWDTPYNVLLAQSNVAPRIGSINSQNSSAGMFGGLPFANSVFSGTSLVGACTASGLGVSAANCFSAGAQFDRREARSVQWWSPNWNGFEARIGYSAVQETTANTANNQAGGLSALRPNMWSLSGGYTNGGLFLGYGYQRMNDFAAMAVRSFGGMTVGQNTAGGFSNAIFKADMNSSTSTGHRFFGKYRFGMGLTIGARYEKQKHQFAYAAAQGATAADITGIEKKTWNLSAAYEMGQHLFFIEYNKSPNISMNGSTNAAGTAGSIINADGTGAKSVGLAYSYALSKRTNLRAYYTQVTNDTNARYTGVVFNGIVGGAGSDPKYYGVGVSHSF